MFQIKDFTSIVASMINYVKTSQSTVTDFTVGSVFRTLIEAPAIEVEELYQQMWLGIKEAIPVALYQAFEFDRLPATAATGSLLLNFSSVTEPFTIPAGTRFVYQANGTSFHSLYETVITAKTTNHTLLVQADQPGLIDVIMKDSRFSGTVQRTSTILAAANFSSGTTEETDDERKQRFIYFIQTIARSPLAAIHYALTTQVWLTDANGIITERVQQAVVVEKFMLDNTQPAGIFYAYLHNGDQAVKPASPELIAQAEKVLNGYTQADGTKVIGYKAAGVRVIVDSVTNEHIAFSLTLTLQAGAETTTVQSAVKSAVNSYLTQLPIGSTAYRAEIIAVVMSVPGVVNMTLQLPKTDIKADYDTKLVMGTWTVS